MIQKLPIFIVGTQRCGTTLLASMLSCHPNLFITQETALLLHIDTWLKRSRFTEAVADLIIQDQRWKDFGIPAELFRQKLTSYKILTPGIVLNAFYDCVVEISGKPRWGDNTPVYSEMLRSIVRIWPDAFIIHIIRDGRAVAASWLKLSWGPKKIDQAAHTWKRRIIKCRADSQVARNFLEIKYEKLVEDPQNILQEICAFIQEKYDDCMLRYPELDGKSRYYGMIQNPNWPERKVYHKHIIRSPDPDLAIQWKTDLDNTQVQHFQHIAGDLLIELGYKIE